MMKTIAVLALTAAVASAQNVPVEFYSESYWPGCKSYSSNEVDPAISAVGSIMNFTYYPYGNARGLPPNVRCQHGENECKGNLIMACAIANNPGTDKWWPMIACMERGDAVKLAEGCAGKAGLDWNTIDTCTTSDQGAAEMTRIAKATQGLQPPHQWTPWVVLNGKPLSSSQLSQSLTKLVCNAYTGSDKPAACNKVELNKVELNYKDEGF